MESLGPADPFQHPTAGMDLRRPGQSAFEKVESLRTTPNADDLRSWKVGGEGEVVVGSYLGHLEESGWLVLHDLALSNTGANVDHLVVGPPGVFSINTKTHRDAAVWVASRMVMVAGARRGEYLVKAVREAKRVQAGIARHTEVPFTVTPALAFICKDLAIKERPTDILVARGSELPRMLAGMAPTLDRHQTWRLTHDVAAWAKTLEQFGQKAS